MHRLYRLLTNLGLLLATTVGVFGLLEAAPGGAMAVYSRHPFAGSGEPFGVQYFAWLLRVLHGDLGWSTSSSEPVSRAIAAGLPATIALAVCAFTVVVVLGAAMGYLRARARTPLLRGALTVPQLVGRALPVFMLALSLQLVLLFTPGLPTGGLSSVAGFHVLDRLQHLVVPVLCLAIPFGAWASVIFYDFFRAADGARALSARDLVAPIAMTASLIGPVLLSACYIVELVFAWPGVARLFLNGLELSDIGLVAGCLLVYCAGIASIRICAELALGARRRTWSGPAALPQTSARRTRRFSALGAVAFVVLLGAAAGAVAANLISPGPSLIDLTHWTGHPLPPGIAGHALGTDEDGRDLLTRLLFAIRTSLGIALFAAAVATAFGALVAQATKLLPWYDDRATLGVAGIRAFAALPFLLATVMVLSERSSPHASLSPLVTGLLIAAVSWPAIVPAFRPLSRATLGSVVDLMAGALLLELTLSFFGFGVQPPIVSLGNLMMNMQTNLAVAAWTAIVPIVVVIVTLTALYAAGDELRALPDRSRSTA